LEGKRITEGRRIAKGKRIAKEGLIESLYQEALEAKESQREHGTVQDRGLRLCLFEHPGFKKAKERMPKKTCKPGAKDFKSD
jgi:hypothetical protein